MSNELFFTREQVEKLADHPDNIIRSAAKRWLANDDKVRKLVEERKNPLYASSALYTVDRILYYELEEENSNT